MADNKDIFAPPTEHELRQPAADVFAPPTQAEVQGDVFAPPTTQELGQAAPTVEVGQALLHGLKHQLIPTAARAAIAGTDYLGLTDSTNPNSLSPINAIAHVLAPDPTYQPDTWQEKAISGVAGFADPALGPIMKVGGMIAKPLLRASGLLTAAERGEKVAAALLSRPQHLARGAIKGATDFGLFGGAHAAISDGAEGKFDPAHIATSTAASAAGGALLGGAGGAALGPYFEKQAFRLEETRRRVQEAFEPGTAGAAPVINLSRGIEGLSGDALAGRVASNRKAMLGLHNKITVAESQKTTIINKLAEAAPELAPVYRKRLTELENETARLQNKFAEAYGGEAYNAVMNLKKAVGDTEVMLNGKKTKLLETYISKNGVVHNPEQIAYVRSLPDTGKNFAGAFGVTDTARTIEAVEGNVRGPLKRMVFEPIEQASANRVAEEAQTTAQFNQLFGKLSSKSQERIYKAVDGDKAISDALLPEEQKAAAFLRQKFDEYFQRVNEVRVANNQSPMAYRQNYITHMKELAELEPWGIKTGESKVVDVAQDLSAPAFRSARERIGTETDTDVSKAFLGYMRSSLRSIHMTKPGNQVGALVDMMPQENLSKGLRTWLQETAFGQMNAKDEALLNNSLPFADKINLPQALSKFGDLFSAGTVKGNIGILAQQPALIPLTAMNTGVRNTLTSLKGEIPQALRRMSPFLTHRRAGKALHEKSKAAFESPEAFEQAIKQGADLYFAEHTWAAAFKQAKKTYQLTDEGAVRYADKIASSIQNAYQDIYKPALLRGKAAKGLFPLQSFGYNMFNMLRKDTKTMAMLKGTSRGAELLKTVAALEFANQMYEVAGLPRPNDLGNPIGLQFDEDWNPSLSQDAVRAPKLGPYSSMAPALYTKFKEGQKVLASLQDLVFDDEKELEERWADFGSNTLKFGKNFVPYGHQAYTTLKGINDLRNGYTTIGREEVDLSEPGDTIIAPLLGSQKTPSANAYREERRLNKLHD